jgi:glycosyltransferase involved in cell wall biosynthesis
MIEAAFAVPGDISLPTGGYVYARRVLGKFPLDGIELKRVALPASFPDPSGADLDETERRLAMLKPDIAVLFDGLAYGTVPAPVVARIKQPIVALVHHPLAHETGLSVARQRELLRLERAALGLARHVVVTSAATKRTLVQDFAVEAANITVAKPGTDPAARARGTGTPVQLLAVGSIVPRKAYDILVRALEPLGSLEWRLTIVGATDRSPAAVRVLHDTITRTGLASRITMTGPLQPDQLADCYDRADVFLMPSLYEGYGMVLAEAMARGLPIVCTTGGAAAETVPDAAAIKVSPGNAGELTDAIRVALEDSSLRLNLANASWAAAQTLPHWEDTARIIAGVVKKVAL